MARTIRPKLEDIRSIVASACGVHENLIIGPGRMAYAVHARTVYMAVATAYGYREYEIAWKMNRGKSSGWHYYKRQKRMSKADANFVSTVKRIRERVELCNTATNMRT